MKIIDNTQEVHFAKLEDGDVCRDSHNNIVMKVDMNSDKFNAVDLESGDALFIDGWVTPLKNVTLTID